MKSIFSKLSILAFTLLLTGCGVVKTPSQETALLKKVHIEQSLKKDISLLLKVISQSDEDVQVQILLENPSLQKISSIRSWVAFPKDILQGVRIEFPDNAPFPLTAPGENTISNEEGLVKIGVSVAAEPIPQKVLTIATVTFKRRTDETAALSFFDTGTHTEVLTFFDGELRSVLKNEKMEPVLIQ